MFVARLGSLLSRGPRFPTVNARCDSFFFVGFKACDSSSAVVIRPAGLLESSLVLWCRVGESADQPIEALEPESKDSVFWWLAPVVINITLKKYNNVV